jgi:hypothetical protein
MIPTMILYGLALGRWWKSAIVSGALLWTVLLVASGEMEVGWALLLGAALGAANTAVGVAVHQGVLRAFRAARGLWGQEQSEVVEGSPRDSDSGSGTPSGGAPPEPGRGDGL